MKANLTFAAIICAISSLLASSAHGQNNSVLSTGQWYKLAVPQNGIYKIDQSFLINMGIDASSIDPRNLAIYGHGGGMLPQENNIDRPIDLLENGIMVQGESDGSFDDSDYVIFFGQSPDRVELNASGILDYQQNLYSDLTYYFLTIKNQPGKRILPVQNEGLNHPLQSTFDDYFIFEEDLSNLIEGGREWYGANIYSQSDQSRSGLLCFQFGQFFECKDNIWGNGSIVGSVIFRVSD